MCSYEVCQIKSNLKKKNNLWTCATGTKPDFYIKMFDFYSNLKCVLLDVSKESSYYNKKGLKTSVCEKLI